jgi:hypothetical protein
MQWNPGRTVLFRSPVTDMMKPAGAAGIQRIRFDTPGDSGLRVDHVALY